jgi:hypothetical protein
MVDDDAPDLSRVRMPDKVASTDVAFDPHAEQRGVEM